MIHVQIKLNDHLCEKRVTFYNLVLIGERPHVHLR